MENLYLSKKDLGAFPRKLVEILLIYLFPVNNNIILNIFQLLTYRYIGVITSKNTINLINDDKAIKIISLIFLFVFMLIILSKVFKKKKKN